MLFKRECINMKGIHDMRRLSQVQKIGAPKTHSSLTRVEETTQPEINERLLAQALRKEEARFKRQDRSLEKTLHKMATMRSVLRGKKVWNERLMQLREQLQTARYRQGTAPRATTPAPATKKKYKSIRLKD